MLEQLNELLHVHDDFHSRCQNFSTAERFEFSFEWVLVSIIIFDFSGLFLTAKDKGLWHKSAIMSRIIVLSSKIAESLTSKINDNSEMNLILSYFTWQYIFEYFKIFLKIYITSNCRQIWRPDQPMSLIVSSILGGVNEQNSIVNKCIWTDDWTAELSTIASNECLSTLKYHISCSDYNTDGTILKLKRP